MELLRIVSVNGLVITTLFFSLLFVKVAKTQPVASRYANLDANYQFEIPHGWHVLVTQTRPVDVILSRGILDRAENLNVKTLGQGMPDAAYQERETIVAQLTELYAGLVVLNTKQVALKDGVHDLLLELLITGQGGQQAYTGQYYFKMGEWGYNVTVTGLAENREELLRLLDQFVEHFAPIE